jgi:hypothetical protein
MFAYDADVGTHYSKNLAGQSHCWSSYQTTHRTCIGVQQLSPNNASVHFLACRACEDIGDDIDRLEAAEAFGRGGGWNRHPVDVTELSPGAAAAVAVLPGSFRQDGLLKSALKGYAGTRGGFCKLKCSLAVTQRPTTRVV